MALIKLSSATSDLLLISYLRLKEMSQTQSLLQHFSQDFITVSGYELSLYIKQTVKTLTEAFNRIGFLNLDQINTALVNIKDLLKKKSPNGKYFELQCYYTWLN